MDIPTILSIVAVIISPLTVLISMKYASSKIKNMVEDQKNDLFEWFKSEEGMVFVATLGKLFGAGAMASLKMPKTSGNMNIFGQKIPTQIVEGIIMPIIQSELKKRGIGFGTS